MTEADIKFELLQIFGSPPDQQFAKLQNLLQSLTNDTERNYFHAAFDAYKDAPRKICLVLIHGIRTHAVWQDKVKRLLKAHTNVKVVPAGFGFLDVFKFLFWFRDTPIRKIARELRDVPSLHPDHQIIVIAHSFGTYVISEILRNEPDIRLSRLILCGSIIPESYRWDTLSRPPAPATVINEVGTNDIWPVLARVGSFGYGPSGSFGFKTGRVIDRFFQYGHSDFFTDNHISGFWKPFVLSGEVVESAWGDERPNPPLYISLLGAFPFIKIILALLLAAIIYGVTLLLG